MRSSSLDAIFLILCSVLLRCTAAYYNQSTKQYALRSGSAYILQYLPAGNTWTGLQQLLPTGISYYTGNGKNLYGYTYGASVSLYAPNPSGTFYAIVGQSCQCKDGVVMC